jgi:2-oxoisovalerate dehydrogenase E2 component (dihydrolipoyl transacylase)
VKVSRRPKSGWLVNEGDHVVANQPLVSVETDKAVVEIPSPWSGTIARLFGIKGDLVKVGAALVEFSEGGEADTGTIVGGVQRDERQRGELEAPASARGLQVLPAIRALARKLDVDLNLVQGIGPGGTITRADVERAARSLTDAGPAGASKGHAARNGTAHGTGARSSSSNNGNGRNLD